jgi:hypothetical protein
VLNGFDQRDVAAFQSHFDDDALLNGHRYLLSVWRIDFTAALTVRKIAADLMLYIGKEAQYL